MKSTRSFALNFYAPLLASVFLILIILVSPKFVSTGSGVTLDAEVIVLGIKIPLPVWLEKVWLLRVGIIIASFVSFIKALTIDFSKYFPARLHVDVYFDEKGIERNVNIFSATERAEISLAADWKQHIASYDEAVKSSLGKLWRQRNLRNMPDMPDFVRDLMNAGGPTIFKVKRLGLLSYRITESNGHLDFNLDVPKKSRRSFHTAFELRETAANHIHPDFWNLLKSPSVVLKPEFKQIFSTEGGEHNAPLDHIVIGWTKIFLLPFPHLTNTVYLWKLPNGTTVPVGYAINTPDSPS